MSAEPKVRRMIGLDSLKVAEGRVAFDVVLLLEAVKLSWVHIHPCQYLKKHKGEKQAWAVTELKKSEGRGTKERKGHKTAKQAGRHQRVPKLKDGLLQV